MNQILNFCRLTKRLSLFVKVLIFPDGVARHNLRGKSAAGLDGLSVYDNLRICDRGKAKLFSLFLIMHWIPDISINSQTIFIPKKNNTVNPAHLRPISISSNLTRQFHKILVNRINAIVKFDKYQFGLQKVDGVARGIDLFQAVLRSTQTDLTL